MLFEARQGQARGILQPLLCSGPARCQATLLPRSPKSISASRRRGPKGSALPPGPQCAPATTRSGCSSSAEAAKASSRAVLPLPASPLTNATAGSPARAASRRRPRRSNSSSRATSRDAATRGHGAAATRGRAAATPAAAPRRPRRRSSPPGCHRRGLWSRQPRGAQLGLEGAAARLILVQRLVPTPGQGQRPHAALMRLFQPGLEAATAGVAAAAACS